MIKSNASSKRNQNIIPSPLTLDEPDEYERVFYRNFPFHIRTIEGRDKLYRHIDRLYSLFLDTEEPEEKDRAILMAKIINKFMQFFIITMAEYIDSPKKKSVAAFEKNQLIKTYQEKFKAVLYELNIEDEEIIEKMMSAIAEIINEACYEKITLPDKAPELYTERKDKKEDAISFLHRVWGRYLEAGVLFQDNLRGKNGLDPSLMIGVINQCRKNGWSIPEFVPPKKARIDMELKDIDNEALSQNYRKAARLNTAIMRRKNS